MRASYPPNSLRHQAGEVVGRVPSDVLRLLRAHLRTEHPTPPDRPHEDTGCWFTEFRSRGPLGALRSLPPRPCGPWTAPRTRSQDACCDSPGRRPPSVPLPLGGHVSAAACSVLRPACGCTLRALRALLASFRHLRISLRHQALVPPRSPPAAPAQN